MSTVIPKNCIKYRLPPYAKFSPVYIIFEVIYAFFGLKENIWQAALIIN